MKAIVIHEHGGVEVLKYEDVATPEPGIGELLVKIKTVGMNHFDHDIRAGISGVDHKLPHIMGVEGAGVVAEVGEGVTDFKVGDHVGPLYVRRPVSCRH